MGVERKGNKFQARYIKDGKRITVGTFKSKSEARRALAVARGSVYASQEAIDEQKVPMAVQDLQASPQPLVLSKPRPVTTWGRIKTWLKNRKAN